MAADASKPPSNPVAAQSNRGASRFDIEAVDTFISLPQIDGLHDIARKEQLDGPVGEYAHFALESREFAKINAAPQEPGEQPAKPHGFPRRERYREFRAGGVMSDDAQRAERIEVKWFRGTAIYCRAVMMLRNWLRRRHGSGADCDTDATCGEHSGINAK